MIGKRKCKILKEIRQRIADANDIEYVTRECEFQGECKGTCPRCEAEVRYLEEQLEKRRQSGKKIAVAAVAAGMLFSATSCDLPLFDKDEEVPMGAPPGDDVIEEAVPEYELTGDVPYVPEEEEEIEGAEEPLEGDVPYIPEELE